VEEASAIAANVMARQKRKLFMSPIMFFLRFCIQMSAGAHPMGEF
jgi:hypothetical protein